MGTKRRKLAVVASVVGVLAVVGAAFAWYAGFGTTTASATAGHAPLSISVSAGTVNGGNPLYPGDFGDVPLTITNTSGHNAHVGSVVMSGVSNSAEPDCLDSWFEAAGVPVPVGQQNLAPGGSVTVHGSLEFIDVDLDQSACSDATITSTWETRP